MSSINRNSHHYISWRLRWPILSNMSNHPLDSHTYIALDMANIDIYLSIGATSRHIWWSLATQMSISLKGSIILDNEIADHIDQMITGNHRMRRLNSDTPSPSYAMTYTYLSSPTKIYPAQCINRTRCVVLVHSNVQSQIQRICFCHCCCCLNQYDWITYVCRSISTCKHKSICLTNTFFIIND